MTVYIESFLSAFWGLKQPLTKPKGPPSRTGWARNYIDKIVEMDINFTLWKHVWMPRPEGQGWRASFFGDMGPEKGVILFAFENTQRERDEKVLFFPGTSIPVRDHGGAVPYARGEESHMMWPSMHSPLFICPKKHLENDQRCFFCLLYHQIWWRWER